MAINTIKHWKVDSYITFKYTTQIKQIPVGDTVLVLACFFVRGGGDNPLASAGLSNGFCVSSV